MHRAIIVPGLAVVLLLIAFPLPAAVVTAPEAATGYRLDTAQIFTLFFITLGPLKLFGPFASATRNIELSAVRRLALTATLVGVICLIAGGLLGVRLMMAWTIPAGALQLGAGIVFFIVAIRGVLAPYEDVDRSHGHGDRVRPMQIAFPMLVTPYGIAAVIALLATARDAQRFAVTLGMLLLVMAMNLLSMLFIRTIMRPSFVAALQVIGAVLGLLQVALAIYIALGALNALGLVSIPL